MLFGRLKGTKIFTTIDLRQGYHHIALTEDSIQKTAFTTPFGKWEFVKCPFGLNQAPAYIMALINNVLEGCDGFAIAYMDDILIYSPDEKTHLKHLEIIFMKLKKAKLKIKISKCSFLKKYLHYLGHLQSEDGMLPMKEKTATIRELVPPTNVHEIQQKCMMNHMYDQWTHKTSFLFWYHRWPWGFLCCSGRPPIWCHLARGNKTSITKSGVTGIMNKSYSGKAAQQGMPAPLAFLNNQKSNTNVQDVPAHLWGLLLLRCYSCHRESALLVPFLHNNNHNQKVVKWENCDTTRCANHCIHTRMQKIMGGNPAQKKEL